MLNFKKSILLFSSLAIVSTFALSSCDSISGGDVVLRILNAEDYIYEYEEGDEENFYDDEENDEQNKNAYQMDMLDQFEIYWENKPENKARNLDLQIVYDTYDTNETMFNELQTGKTTYDVIVPSDYMVQKLASLNMLHELDHKEELWSNISSYLESSLKNVLIPDADGNPIEGSTLSDYDFCVPYMWGTLGIMYNVDYYVNALKGAFPNITEDDIHELFKSWDCLYSEELSGTFSIKDSVRDTYTICLIHALRDLGVNTSTSSDELKALINRHDSETIEIVKEDMLALKDNAFGFETDSGKTDMTTQKIGANLCWSGDATWAITEARDNDLNLYYSLPIGDKEGESRSGSNIWFDCFCMPKNDNGTISEEQQAQYDLGEEFIEFMSRPENASQNCYCVGYTPAVAGTEMLDYMRSCYDVPTMLDEQAEALEELKDSLMELSSDELYSYFEDYGYDEEEFVETLLETKPRIEYIEDLEFDSIVRIFKDEVVDYIYDVDEQDYLDALEDFNENKDDPSCYVEYDLSYFFNDEEGNDVFIVDVDTSMRELRAQYPTIDDLDRLAIMNDFGPVGNQALLDMWESVRTNPLPIWAIILFACEAVIALGIVAYFVSKKINRKRLKKARI